MSLQHKLIVLALASVACSAQAHSQSQHFDWNAKGMSPPEGFLVGTLRDTADAEFHHFKNGTLVTEAAQTTHAWPKPGGTIQQHVIPEGTYPCHEPTWGLPGSIADIPQPLAPSAVPEPSTAALLLSGLALYGLCVHRNGKPRGD